MYRQIQFTCQLFREGDQIVSLCPELNVSSFGNTRGEAEAALHEAVTLFLEECERMGTLNEVLEEEGFTVRRQKGDHIVMTRPGVKRPVVKTSPRKVPVTHIRTSMTTAGMSRERYFELLKQVK